MHVHIPQTARRVQRSCPRLWCFHLTSGSDVAGNSRSASVGADQRSRAPSHSFTQLQNPSHPFTHLYTPSHPFTHLSTHSHFFKHLHTPSDMSSRILKLKWHQPDLQWIFDPIHTVFGALCWGIAATPVEGDASYFELWPETPSTDVEVSIHVDGHWQDTRSVKVIREVIIRDVWYHFFQCEYESSFVSPHFQILTLEHSLSSTRLLTITDTSVDFCECISFYTLRSFTKLLLLN